ncbi:PIR Superfamily Protein [Plasmodium ovale wallikeri]|uniref:PIR Superfamily Protein n=2 Tax=Plasmodium ovale TaxID=36330 RepID=A0A1A8YNZ6_PLAOA|nr:PIR Superfamily Protein [Plasmodium ovale wallikeri]SBT58893.1 PIR Superfamily Protein [Plasmodium ovale wallikeri]SBT73360.1 PIR protein [Plasmodium ovale]
MHLDPQHNKLLTQHTLKNNEQLKGLYDNLNKECKPNESLEDLYPDLVNELSQTNVRTFFEKWVCNYSKHSDGYGFISVNQDFKNSCRYLKYWFYDQIVANELSSDKIHKMFNIWNTLGNLIIFPINDVHNRDSGLGDNSHNGFYSSYGLNHYPGLNIGPHGFPYPELDRDRELYVDGHHSDSYDNYTDTYSYPYPYELRAYGYYNGDNICSINVSTLEEITIEKLLIDYAEYYNSKQVEMSINELFCKDPYKIHINKAVNLCNHKNRHRELEELVELEELDDCYKLEEKYYCDVLEEIMGKDKLQNLSELQCNEENMHEAPPDQQSEAAHPARESSLGSSLPSGGEDDNLQALKGSPHSGNSNVNTSVTVPTSLIGILGIFFSLYKLTPLGTLLRKTFLKENTIQHNLGEETNRELFGNISDSDDVNMNNISNYVSYNP